MKHETFVSIPQPCHENWESMAPHDKGRFCLSCAKTVVDFSMMSDTQVLNYLNQSKGRLCGRFAPDQLERPLHPLHSEKKKIWWMAALMPVMLFITKLNAQKKATEKIESNQCERLTGQVADKDTALNYPSNGAIQRIISGKVIDNNSLPVQGASVFIKETNIGIATDSSGKFQLEFPATDSFVNITISSVGYEEKYFNYLLTDNTKIELDSIILEPLFTRGLIAVAGGISYCRPVKKIDTAVHKIRKIFHAEAFSIYPNPAKQGTTIKIDVKKEGYYCIQLLDVSSKLIHTAIFDATKDATITSFFIPASAAAGIYFIRLINEDNQKQYTEKIIVD